jgi:hypothetical protein
MYILGDIQKLYDYFYVHPIKKGSLKKGEMKNSLKGAFLSGVVFPGLGQIILGHRKRGIALMLIVLASLFVIVAKAVQQALTILEKIESGGSIDFNAISNAATQALTTSDKLIFNLVLLLTLICWIIGVVDAYIIGKKKDSEEQSTSQLLSSKGN